VRTRLLGAAGAFLALLACAQTPHTAAEVDQHLGPARDVAPGVALYHVRDQTWVTPANGFVRSFGGRQPPDILRSLQKGSRIDLETIYAPIDGDAERWRKAAEIVGGAGLLLRDGARVDNWTVESLSVGFADTRHPRTLIATRPDGSLWLVTVDGRQPELSAGMTLVELRAAAERLG
jgi:hypothetical protein